MIFAKAKKVLALLPLIITSCTSNPPQNTDNVRKSPDLVTLDCPNGTFQCPDTGVTVTYGKCWKGLFTGCQPCDAASPANLCSSTMANQNWMATSTKVQNSSLNNITIPGAHDAGMGKITDCTSPISLAKYAAEDLRSDLTQTQDKSFRQMLNLGIRYFDVRPTINKDGIMYLGHLGDMGGTLGIQGCWGYSMDEMLEDLKNFVANGNNKEVIILKFGNATDLRKSGFANFDYNDYKLVESRILAKLSNYLIIGKKDSLKTTLIKDLTSNGSKIIVAFPQVTLPSGASGYDGSNGIYYESALNIYDDYANKANYEEMKNDQFEKFNKPENQGRYFLLSWTMTMNDDLVKAAIATTAAATIAPIPLPQSYLSIRSLANIANSHLSELPGYFIPKNRYPNIILTDYVSVDEARVSTILNANRP